MNVSLNTAVVASLVAAQFPQWSRDPIVPISPQGWDNRTFRLGGNKKVRIPSAEAYSGQPQKEWRWLPELSPSLPLPIPVPIALGMPGEGYPWNWTICPWIEGDIASGEHNFFRGGSLRTYDIEARNVIEALEGEINASRALSIWEMALASSWDKGPVWLHGDVSAANLLIRNGRLAAVIDFGNCAVGDPACDLAIAWSLCLRRKSAGIS